MICVCSVSIHVYFVYFKTISSNLSTVKPYTPWYGISLPLIFIFIHLHTKSHSIFVNFLFWSYFGKTSPKNLFQVLNRLWFFSAFFFQTLFFILWPKQLERKCLSGSIFKRIIALNLAVRLVDISRKLTLSVYLLYIYVKEICYSDKPELIQNLENHIRQVINDIRPQFL